ncbi:hypothetical protein [Pseudoruegeria sp. SK021]|uniref:hypothetical protein n=1 Tax=Pseudoruegeria sp. SK021 TaxID=1933035 RepID=UPI000A24CA01|nr:hypothetical protein [Pseudoruegeria sp. SK021]OSP53539.1 hypothetical protein BV911_17465 [Pseudoruegeria sp. SK021]
MTKNRRPPPERLAHKSDDDLLALALASGALTWVQLWKLDQPLARELRRRGLMNRFAPRRNSGSGRSSILNKLPDNELLAEARRMIELNGIASMRELKVRDWRLVELLQKRNLTSHLGQQYGWKTRRRTGAAAIVDDPRVLSGTQLVARALKLEPQSLSDLQREDSVLFHALRKDPTALPAFREALGLRRAPRNWSEMTDDDWLNLAREFDSAAHFKHAYQAAWTRAGEFDKRRFLIERMHSEGQWTNGLYDQDGYRCESVAELLVFNLLIKADVRFERHPSLPFPHKSRAARADAYLPEQNSYIEIWMCSERSLIGRTDSLPTWFPSYVRKRQTKLAKYAAANLAVVSLDAEIARLQDTKAFLEHVVSLLNPVCAVTWQDPQELRISSSAPALVWSIDELLVYAALHGLTQLSDFQRHPHRAIYNIVTVRELRDDLRKALDKAHGRRSAIRKADLLEISLLVAFCRNHGIVSKSGYRATFKRNELPFGAPSDVAQSYKVSWQEFLGWIRT